MKRIEYFQTESGQMPCRDWLLSLEGVTQARIDAYIKRVAAGGARKNVRSVGRGVYEIKIALGPGYRVYFAEVGGTLILLLMGGDKSTQFRDIKQAQEFWRHYVSKQ